MVLEFTHDRENMMTSQPDAWTHATLRVTVVGVDDPCTYGLESAAFSTPLLGYRETQVRSLVWPLFSLYKCYLGDTAHRR